MKQIKVILTTVVAFLFVSTTVVFNACNQDLCKDISCKNNGVCRDGSCNCSLGFEGPFCATRAYEKFIGTYDGYYRCNGTDPKLRTLVISPDAQPNKVILYNIMETQDITLTGTVDGVKITLDETTVGNHTYSGNGHIVDLDITLFIQDYYALDSTTHTCTYNGNKFIK